ncbi:MAG: SCO family protein [Polyangiaceae bacterium]|nr:SCO family protein [Polyangiaceae bacterium]
MMGHDMGDAPELALGPPAAATPPTEGGATRGAVGRLRALVLAVAVATLALCIGAAVLLRPRAPPLEVLGQLPVYRLEDQRGQPFGTDELRGKVYAAAFFFTSCPTVCPRISSAMAAVQARSERLGAAFHLVSFTVDPENDTVEVLADYAREYRADPARWTFLRGDEAALMRVVVDGFKLAMGKEPGGPSAIFHSEKLVLVDRDGRIRGYYEATDAGAEVLVDAAARLVDEGE